MMYCTGVHSAVYTVEMKIKAKEKGNVVLDWYTLEGTNHHRPLGRQGGRARR